jgi:Dolichyl-phosphate-mannose-protein mannosyltransferase
MLSAPGVSKPREDGSSPGHDAPPPLAMQSMAPRWRRLAPYGLPVLAALAALAVSWHSWIDPFVDSGREMDVPWRLLQGERLYGDVTYYYGPIGPWVNALALRLFGNGWLSLELVCAALSALIFALLFRLTRRAGGLLSAVTATTLAAAICIAAPRGGAFVFPYSSSGLFALAGGLLALDAAAAPGRRRRWLAALGVAVALASRLEIGAAAAIALLLAGIRSRHREETRADAQAVALGALIAGAVYGVALAGIPASSPLADGPFGPILGMPKEWAFLYRMISGVEQPGNASTRILVSLLLDGLLLAAAAWWALPRTDRSGTDRSGTDRSGADRPLAGPLHADRPARTPRFAIAGLLLLAAYLLSPWCDSAKNLPPLLDVLPPVALVAALALLRRPLEARARPQFLLFFFSAAVAARVFFRIEVGPRMGPHTSLAIPGLLATAAVLVFDLLAPRLPAPEVFRRRLAAVFAVAGILFLYRVERLDHRPQIAELRTAAGDLRLPAAKAAAIARTLEYLQGRARPGDTLTAFPESGFFNFVTGLRSPLRQDLIVPGVLSGSREAAAVRRIDAAGPKYILLCNRTTAEFGPAAFGRDYAVQLWSDVGRHYVLAAAFGPAAPGAPVGAKDFFIRLYERSPAVNAPIELTSTGPRRQPTPSISSLE